MATKLDTLARDDAAVRSGPSKRMDRTMYPKRGVGGHSHDLRLGDIAQMSGPLFFQAKTGGRDRIQDCRHVGFGLRGEGQGKVRRSVFSYGWSAAGPFFVAP